MIPAPEKDIVFFDGVCHLCTGSVTWILKRDHQKKFYFCSLQSPLATEYIRSVMPDYNPEELGSILLLRSAKIYSKSTAALLILQDLRGWGWVAKTALWFPRFLRDSVYRLIAKYRYKIFGKSEACMVPTEELRSRFLG